MITHWIVTPGLDSTLNYDPGLNFTFNCDPESWLNVKLWHEIGVTIQYGILTRGHNSTWISDPSTRWIATQEGVKIQQRDQNSTAKEGHNSTKNPLNIDPGFVFYVISAYTFQVFDFPIIDQTKFAWIKYSLSRTRVFRPHPPRDESRDRSKKSPFFDKVLLQLWSLQKQTKCLIFDSDTCWGSVLMIYVFKFRLIIILPNTPTPSNDVVGCLLVSQWLYICGKVVSAQ